MKAFNPGFGGRRVEVARGVRALGRDETIRLPLSRAAVLLRVESGCVVVTREGDIEDHVLGAGEELRLAGRGLAVAWALAPSTVVLADPRAPATHEARPRGAALNAA